MLKVHNSLPFNMSLMSIFIVIGFLYLTFSAPFVIAALFILSLGITSLLAGTADRFLGFVVFVVYVGGALVLFSYCFMLTPLQDTNSSYSPAVFPFMFVSLNIPSVSHGTLYEFYWVSSLLVCVGVLLFIVMLCVVSLIDFSQGSMRVK